MTKEILPPSHFAELGQPCCSLWGKSEIEWLAAVYVKALAKDGDVWKPLTAERILKILTREEVGSSYWVLKDQAFEGYRYWLDLVREMLKDQEGALKVWSLSLPTLARLAGKSEL